MSLVVSDQQRMISQEVVSCCQGSPQRVLFVMENLGVGGTEQAFISLMNLWAVPNTKVEIFLKSRGGIFEQFLRKDLPIISEKEAYSRFYDVAACFYGPKADSQTEVTKVHAKRRVQWIHADLSACPEENFFNRKELYEGVDAFIGVAKKCAESARKICPPARDKIFAIPNVLDQELIKRKAAELIPSFPRDGVCNVVSVGRLSYEKGYRRAVKVFSQLDREGILFRWYIIGEGAARSKLERQIQQVGLKDKVILLGQKTNPYPYMVQADIFCMPSRCEGWGLAVTEAKILGRPILFTDVASARDQIDSETNGLIVDNNKEAIYVGLRRLLLDEKLREKFSAALQGYTYDNCSIYQQIEKVFFGNP
jgi:glycosyltransferase involved in cell wall biosynthesis